MAGFDSSGMTPHGRCEDGLVVRCTFTGGHTLPFGSGTESRRRYALLIWEFFSVASSSTVSRSALPAANANLTLQGQINDIPTSIARVGDKTNKNAIAVEALVHGQQPWLDLGQALALST